MSHKTLAEKVDWLFDVRRGPHGRQYTYGHVQRATGNRITASYVWKLRTGTMRNPGLGALEALADFFGVPLGYFAEGGEYLEPSVRITHALPESSAARQDALRLVTDLTGSLSDQSLCAVMEVVEYLRAREDVGVSRGEGAPEAVVARAARM